jgi:hypothetical protein
MSYFDRLGDPFMRLLKGDRPGHEFHGNQYTSMGHSELADRVLSLRAQARIAVITTPDLEQARERAVELLTEANLIGMMQRKK